MRPSDKMTASALAGAATVLATWVVQVALNVNIPGEAQAALAVILSFLFGYFTEEHHPAPSAVEHMRGH